MQRWWARLLALGLLGLALGLGWIGNRIDAFHPVPVLASDPGHGSGGGG